MTRSFIHFQRRSIGFRFGLYGGRKWSCIFELDFVQNSVRDRDRTEVRDIFVNIATMRSNNSRPFAYWVSSINCIPLVFQESVLAASGSRWIWDPSASPNLSGWAASTPAAPDSNSRRLLAIYRFLKHSRYSPISKSWEEVFCVFLINPWSKIICPSCIIKKTLAIVFLSVLRTSHNLDFATF